MKIRITDDFLPGEELILDVDTDDAFEDVQLPKEQAYEVIGFWESTAMGGGRGSYEPEDANGLIVLAQVESLGDDIEMAAWYEVDRDGYYPLSGFPFTTLEAKEVDPPTIARAGVLGRSWTVTGSHYHHHHEGEHTMSLNWDVNDVAVVPDDKDEREAWYQQVSYDQPGVPENERLTNWQLIDSLIWRSMVLGWGWKLKPALVEKAIKRNKIYEIVFSEYRGPALPPAFIADMVGFETNVSPVTDAEFFKDMRRHLEERARAAYRNHVDAVEKARADA